MREENTTFSGPVLHYLNLQFRKYLFQCLAFGALRGHAKEAFCTPWEARAEGAWLEEELKPSKERSRPKQLISQDGMRETLVMIVRWYSVLMFFLNDTKQLIMLSPWQVYNCSHGVAELPCLLLLKTKKTTWDISFQTAAPSLHANLSYVWWSLLCQNHTISIHVNIFPLPVKISYYQTINLIGKTHC